MGSDRQSIAAVDLFCGAGGLSLGLQQAGIDVVAGVDLDPSCEYPYKENIRAEFLLKDVAQVSGADLTALWPADGYRLLAGCAPCQPFSSHRRGADTSGEDNWALLSHFARLVEESEPDYVTMENVTRVARAEVFQAFVEKLRALGYHATYGVLYGPDFGLPQERRRLVLMASRQGTVKLPTPTTGRGLPPTVRDTISHLPRLHHGESDPADPLHTARRLTPLNAKRMRASKAGGTWRDWPEELLAPCHRKATGASFQAFYGRMQWDTPSPTITTQSYNFGTGRFGHPEQDRSITLREAAMLQGFPKTYKFTPPGTAPSMRAIGRLIGNAVPPPLGVAIGTEFLDARDAHQTRPAGDAPEPTPGGTPVSGGQP